MENIASSYHLTDNLISSVLMSKSIFYYKSLLRALVVQSAVLKDASLNLNEATKTYSRMVASKDKSAVKYITKKHKMFN